MLTGLRHWTQSDPICEATLVSDFRTGRAKSMLPLDSRSYTVQHDSHVKRPRVLPTMCDFGTQSVPISIVELWYVLKVRRALSNKRAFAQKRDML